MSRDHAVLSQEFPGTHQGDRGFFSVRGSHSYSQPSRLHEKNRIGRVALREGRLFLFQVDDSSAKPSLGEKGPGIENSIAICWFWFGRGKPERLCKVACGRFCGSNRINRRNPFGSTALAAGWSVPGAHYHISEGEASHNPTLDLLEALKPDGTPVVIMIRLIPTDPIHFPCYRNITCHF